MQFITRAYNSFEIDSSNLSVVIKRSKETRLLEEIGYYDNLPKELAPFFPRHFHSDKIGPEFRLGLEYYAYQNVGNKMISHEYDDEFWNSFFNIIGKYFKAYKSITESPKNENDCRMMFIDKTEKEYQSLVDNFMFFGELTSHDTINLNGRKLRSFSHVWPKVRSYIDGSCLSEKTYLIHGDLCFSNILFGQNPINNDVIIKLIDPRGSFGGSMLGDMYYDLAKLSHSSSGGYEYFINDSFEVKSDGNKCTLSYDNDNKDRVNDLFIKFVEDNEFDMKKIKTLEGAIFIGMCARHYDSPERQKAMFLTGLRILNDIYETV